MSDKLVVVFVDDDPDVLTGMKNMLFRDRARWDMVFVCGGTLAIEHLKANRFDVVVSDMRMPDLDGEAVIEAATAANPRAGRIVLSGYANDADRVRLLPRIDAWLGKPCGVIELRAAIERSSALRA